MRLQSIYVGELGKDPHIFYLESSYHERHMVQGRGLRWHAPQKGSAACPPNCHPCARKVPLKVWWTESVRTAATFERYAEDPETLSAIGCVPVPRSEHDALLSQVRNLEDSTNRYITALAVKTEECTRLLTQASQVPALTKRVEELEAQLRGLGTDPVKHDAAVPENATRFSLIETE